MGPEKGYILSSPIVFKTCYVVFLKFCIDVSEGIFIVHKKCVVHQSCKGIFSIRYSGVHMSALKSVNIANTDDVQELVLLTSKCIRDVEKVFEGAPHKS